MNFLNSLLNQVPDVIFAIILLVVAFFAAKIVKSLVNKLLKMINSYDIQSIITTTDLKNINKNYLVDSFIYKVKNGNIERK